MIWDCTSPLSPKVLPIIAISMFRKWVMIKKVDTKYMMFNTWA